MIRRQRGATIWTWMLVLGGIAVSGLVAVRLIPVYMEAFTVRSVVEALATDLELRGGGRGEVVESLFKRLSINSIDSIKRENLKFQDVGAGLEMIVEYEKRVPLFGNLDGVASFREQVVVPR